MESEDPRNDDQKDAQQKAQEEEAEGRWITFPDPAKDWRPFLRQWSEQYIAWHDPDREPAPSPEAVRQGWLGSAPAEPAEISALEERLGLTLPRSLRTFLQTTNGWPDTGFLPAIAKASEIGFMRDLDDTWIRVSRYFDECEAFYWPGTTVLERSVQISVPKERSALFLDPEDVNDDGEWAAYIIERNVPDQGFETLFDLFADFYVLFYDCRYPWDE